MDKSLSPSSISMPITTTSPASNYWGIDQDVSYGQEQSLLNGASGIMDTGTTLLMLATDAFQAYQKATGAKMDKTTGLLSITEQQYEKLQSLFFNLLMNDRSSSSLQEIENFEDPMITHGLEMKVKIGTLVGRRTKLLPRETICNTAC